MDFSRALILGRKRPGKFTRDRDGASETDGERTEERKTRLPALFGECFWDKKLEQLFYSVQCVRVHARAYLIDLRSFFLLLLLPQREYVPAEEEEK